MSNINYCPKVDFYNYMARSNLMLSWLLLRKEKEKTSKNIPKDIPPHNHSGPISCIRLIRYLTNDFFTNPDIKFRMKKEDDLVWTVFNDIDMNYANISVNLENERGRLDRYTPQNIIRCDGETPKGVKPFTKKEQETISSYIKTEEEMQNLLNELNDDENKVPYIQLNDFDTGIGTLTITGRDYDFYGLYRHIRKFFPIYLQHCLLKQKAISIGVEKCNELKQYVDKIILENAEKEKQRSAEERMAMERAQAEREQRLMEQDQQRHRNREALRNIDNGATVNDRNFRIAAGITDEEYAGVQSGDEEVIQAVFHKVFVYLRQVREAREE